MKKYWRYFVTQLYYKYKFGEMGGQSIIYAPVVLSGEKGIYVGEKTVIRDGGRLEVINRPELGWEARLKIGKNVNIEQGVHIVCQCNITIEDDVSLTPYCAVVDTYHPHDPPDEGLKIGARLPTEPSFVHIGKGTFVGMKTVILPNVRIGKGCVIGAGSVVDKDIPDYCMAAGSPVQIVSIFDQKTRNWI